MDSENIITDINKLFTDHNKFLIKMNLVYFIGLYLLLIVNKVLTNEAWDTARPVDLFKLILFITLNI